MKPRRLFAFITALILLMSAAGNVFAAEPETDDLIRQMLNFYHYHQKYAEADIACLNEKLAATDAAQAEKWENIFGYWTLVNEEMEINPEVLPDGLPDDDSLCIVVLGYGLKANGDMQDELIGRLEVALASAEKYPNAYIACTGGGTASRDPDATEADRMAQWLLEQGIDEKRIIIENQSRNTAQNAQFTCDILASQYPGVKHLAIITSDYHLPRGCLLFFAQAQLSSNNPPDIISQAAYDAVHEGSESISGQAFDVAKLAGVSISDMTEPELAQLTEISVAGPTEHEWNSPLRLTVTAHYDSGLSRDVTDEAAFTGFDPTTAGVQTVFVSYLEKTDEIEILILPEPTDAPTSVPTESTLAAEPTAPQEIRASGSAPLLLIVAWIALLVLLVILLIIKKSRK